MAVNSHVVNCGPFIICELVKLTQRLDCSGSRLSIVNTSAYWNVYTAMYAIPYRNYLEMCHPICRQSSNPAPIKSRDVKRTAEGI